MGPLFVAVRDNLYERSLLQSGRSFQVHGTVLEHPFATLVEALSLDV